jgi:hypothetical protein
MIHRGIWGTCTSRLRLGPVDQSVVIYKRHMAVESGEAPGLGFLSRPLRRPRSEIMGREAVTYLAPFLFVLYVLNLKFRIAGPSLVDAGQWHSRLHVTDKSASVAGTGASNGRVPRLMSWRAWPMTAGRITTPDEPRQMLTPVAFRCRAVDTHATRGGGGECGMSELWDALATP